VSDNVTIVNVITSATIANAMTSSKIVNAITSVNIVDETVRVVTVASQGPPGISSGPITKVAHSILSGGRVVKVAGNDLVDYADKDSTNVSNVLGITLNAAAQGASVSVQMAGEITEPTWMWTLGLPIFLGNDGQMTQAVPTSGYLLQVAIPVSSTKVNVAIMPAIKLV